MTAAERVAALFDGDAGDVYRAETATRAEVEQLIADVVAGERARCVRVVERENCDHPANVARMVELIRSGEESS